MQNLPARTRYKLVNGEQRAAKVGGRANAREIWTAGRTESRELWLKGMDFLYSIHEEIADKLLAIRQKDDRMDGVKDSGPKEYWVDLEDNKDKFSVGYFDNLVKS